MADNNPRTTNAGEASTPHQGAITATQSRHETTPAQAGANPTLTADQQQTQVLPELVDAEADFDSAYESDGYSTGSTSVTSNVLRGHFEHGRRYQNVKDMNYNIPSDEKQFESMHAGHFAYTVLESLRANPYFRSPISKNAQHIIDVGTGSGGWANEVADMFPQMNVLGVDLYPPPTEWVAPNCKFEVDDCTRDWTWNHKFDLVHMRLMVGALTEVQVKALYQHVYDNLEPGGWIEHIDVTLDVRSIGPNPLPEGSMLSQFGPIIRAAAQNAGTVVDMPSRMKEDIEATGFSNIHEHDVKLPIGDWSKHPIYRQTGHWGKILFDEGLEGWVMWLLTKYGAPKPWSPEEVHVYVAQARNELKAGYHIYQDVKRVWAQKPLDAKEKAVQ